MAKRLFVGKLPYETNDTELSSLFSQAGTITDLKVIIDKFTGQSKGFAFVEMSSDEEADRAISMFNGYAINGRNIVVNEARPPEPRTGGGGRGGFGGGDRGGFGGGFGGQRRDSDRGGRRGGFGGGKRW